MSRADDVSNVDRLRGPDDVRAREVGEMIGPNGVHYVLGGHTV